MNKSFLYITIVFILIPVYIFGDSINIFIKNMNKITYSLEIPKNQSIDTKNENYEIPPIPKISEKETLRQLWVLLIDDNKEKETKILLEGLGIKNLISIKIKQNKDKVDAIGPFLDKEIAIKLQKKIISYNKNLDLSLHEIVE